MKKRKAILIIIVFSVLCSLAAWKIIRRKTELTCTPWEQLQTTAYTEEERVLTAMALSYLVYGCEGCEKPEGTVSEILDTEKMGIIIENADIRRTDPSDRTTAVLDSAAFIRQLAGEYRLLSFSKDEKSSFYGAAFADDANQVVWIAYSGSVSLADCLQSAGLVLAPGLTKQEENAFAFYEQVLLSEEITEKGYDLILTGHSLGGALSTMISCAGGAEAVTINGADGVALDKIRDITGNSSSEHRIANYMVSPDNGKRSFKDLVQRLMFLGSWKDVEYHVYEQNDIADNAHGVFGFIQYENGTPQLP